MITQENSARDSVKSHKLLEFAVDLEIYDLLSNSRIKKLDVIEATDELDAKRKVRWKYGTTAEVEKIQLF